MRERYRRRRAGGTSGVTGRSAMEQSDVPFFTIVLTSDTSHPVRVAFLGLGAIGRPMAKHLAKQHDLTVWNRTRARADEFAAASGARAAATPREARAPGRRCARPAERRRPRKTARSRTRARRRPGGPP